MGELTDFLDYSGAGRKSFQIFVSFCYYQAPSVNISVAQELINLYLFSFISCPN